VAKALEISVPPGMRQPERYRSENGVVGAGMSIRRIGGEELRS
jgi:hypothetical protein